MKTKERINLNDSTMTAVSKMSEGNPGAMNALMKLITEGSLIDVDDIMGGLGKVLLLDTFGIYGTDIYVLYSDICEKNLSKMVAVLRATQLGMFSAVLLKEACHRQDYSGRDMIPVEELYIKVTECLPKFDLANRQSS